MSRREGPVVTIDGPAGAGKSTTAREVARRLGFRHLDSGALYRALTFALLDADVPEERWPRLDVEDLRALGVDLEPTPDGFRVRLGERVLERELRSAEVTSLVSRLARLPAARASLLELQRRAGALGRLVADGRDMGTVVFPDAEVKVYLSADLEERARRRLRDEGIERPSREEIARQAEAIAERDCRDSEREASPLRRPPDAREIDTTSMTFEEQVAAIVALVEASL
ncbi:MAG TPA: (d)CMP kinase [Longimicrobiales bacterium]|nr:(d)CMP kinase [Longimicrobiales bacterium]